jgi:toxin secretion/phage lysis holin
VGIAKKVMMFAVIATAHLIDVLLGGGHLLRDGTITFYLCNELISILENSVQVGIPIPNKLRQAIHILKQKEEAQDGDKTTPDSETV